LQHHQNHVAESSHMHLGGELSSLAVTRRLNLALA